jgi:DAK2 domain fusion protein YloV
MIERVQELSAGALAAMEAARRRIDDLNVYPVPDGDTGTNLTLTMRAIDEAVQASSATSRQAIAKEVSRAALMGARGNSGVILSQIVRGAADVLAVSDDLPKAFRSASDAAYRAVRRPVEGTMLTAIRELAEEAEANRALAPAGLLPKLVARGDDCVARTTGMLDVLKEAGVVDSGAAGLVEIVRGITAALNGEELPAAPPEHDHLGVEAIHQELSRYRYCTVFLVEGEELDAEGLEDELEQLGDSLLVVGDPSALKVHVHTDDPGKALSLGVARGALSGVEIADMHAQTVRREERLLDFGPAESAPTSAIVVSVGEGNAALFESLGARVVDGGDTMNPSTAEILAAIEAAPGTEAVVLPNNKNVIMSAEQAADHASKTVRVLPTVSLPGGLAAIVAFDPSRTAVENLREMGDVLREVATGAVTVASRDVQMNGLEIRKGAFLGLVDGEAVAGGDGFDEVAAAVVERLLAEPRGVLTLLTGEEAPVLNGVLSRVAIEHPDIELEVHEGGQPHYPLLLSAE